MNNTFNNRKTTRGRNRKQHITHKRVMINSKESMLIRVVRQIKIAANYIRGYNEKNPTKEDTIREAFVYNKPITKIITHQPEVNPL